MHWLGQEQISYMILRSFGHKESYNIKPYKEVIPALFFFFFWVFWLGKRRKLDYSLAKCIAGLAL